MSDLANPGGTATLAVTATDVTGTMEMPVEIPNDLSGLDAAQSIAALMLLPEDDWVLRDNRTGAYVQDEDRVGEKLSPGASVTVTTRAHLG
jgi:hypothetical protein